MAKPKQPGHPSRGDSASQSSAQGATQSANLVPTDDVSDHDILDHLNIAKDVDGRATAAARFIHSVTKQHLWEWSKDFAADKWSINMVEMVAKLLRNLEDTSNLEYVKDHFRNVIAGKRRLGKRNTNLKLGDIRKAVAHFGGTSGLAKLPKKAAPKEKRKKKSDADQDEGTDEEDTEINPSDQEEDEDVDTDEEQSEDEDDQQREEGREQGEKGDQQQKQSTRSAPKQLTTSKQNGVIPARHSKSAVTRSSAKLGMKRAAKSMSPRVSKRTRTDVGTPSAGLNSQNAADTSIAAALPSPQAPTTTGSLDEVFTSFNNREMTLEHYAQKIDSNLAELRLAIEKDQQHLSELRDKDVAQRNQVKSDVDRHRQAVKEFAEEQYKCREKRELFEQSKVGLGLPEAILQSAERHYQTELDRIDGQTKKARDDLEAAEKMLTAQIDGPSEMTRRAEEKLDGDKARQDKMEVDHGQALVEVKQWRAKKMMVELSSAEMVVLDKALDQVGLGSSLDQFLNQIKHEASINATSD
ncbi:hypothetical protein FALBO_15999 [Fusarium albosuccineum]|uniref:Uncharacterized protein n=1 Tax=Fusarium albosuccineum TaxID=1237068 RepID=A0A8H4KQC8_9HYPO|nr:hypothetical protein FALBO_15999 [Fusarium albosuccineum]